MKKGLVAVAVIGVAGLGAYLWRRSRRITETREITEEEFNQLCENWAKEVMEK